MIYSCRDALSQNWKGGCTESTEREMSARSVDKVYKKRIYEEGELCEIRNERCNILTNHRDL